MKIAVIINTWNKPRQLDAVFGAFERGSQLPAEFIVADDGSGEETGAVIRKWQQKLAAPIQHAWQPNEGYRRSRILNKAIAMTRADYLVFIDGDCLPRRHFVKDHVALAQKDHFVQARRVFIKEAIVNDYLDGKVGFAKLLLTGKISGIFKLIRTPKPLISEDQVLHGILGCNLAIWRKDLLAVNGYDESFVGWGAEDSELAARLYHSGIRRNKVHGRAILMHLDHPQLSRDRYENNKGILQQTLDNKKTRCKLGLDQHMEADA